MLLPPSLANRLPADPFAARWRRRLRWLGLVLVGLLLSWAIASCGGPAPQADASGDRAEIEFWTMQLQPKFTDYFNEAIANFEAQHPDLAVRWTDVPWAAMESKILTAVSAGTAPDVVNLNPNFASQLAARDAWLTLDDRISADVRDRYLPEIWAANQLNGTTFGVPWYLTTRVSLYNRDLLAAAGLDAPPATYAELADAARAIREETGKYAFFTPVLPDDSAELLESFVQMGVTLLDEEGNAAFDSPEGRAAFQYWVDLYRDGLLPRDVLTQGHRRAIELYQAGETAILASGAEFLSEIATNAPTVAAASAAAPQITGDTGKVGVAVMNLAVPRSSDRPDDALEFALFLTNDENQLAFARAANVLPSTQQALADLSASLAAETAAAPKAADAEAGAGGEGDGAEVNVEAALAQARRVAAEQLPSAEVLLPAREGLKDLQRILYDNLQAAMLGEVDADAAIADAVAEWNGRPRG